MKRLDPLDRDLLQGLLVLWHDCQPWYTKEPLAWRELATRRLVTVIRIRQGNFVIPHPDADKIAGLRRTEL